MIYLEFDDIKLEIELFEHPVNDELKKLLPISIDLQKWGNEYYGEIPVLKEQIKSVDTIPPGGLAYSKQGNYLCIFFGQKPAWPVDHIGKIIDDKWDVLLSSSYSIVTILEEI